MKADAGLEMRGVGPQGCEAGTKPLGKGDAGSIERAVGSTPFRPCGGLATLDKIRKTTCRSLRRASERSVAAVRNPWASESIRQKIIGHKMAVGWCRTGGGFIRRSLDVGGAHIDIALAQLEEHASDHSVGIFVEQLIEERIDFLAQIGGVTKARKFVAVQSVAGSGEKEFPRRLGAAGGHVGLRWTRIAYNARYRTTVGIVLTSNSQVLSLWKSVENEEKSARACSGCAGDYEDPDRSAWEADFEREEADLQEEAGDEPGTAE
jgi:hypothetical protein